MNRRVQLKEKYFKDGFWSLFVFFSPRFANLWVCITSRMQHLADHMHEWRLSNSMQIHTDGLQPDTPPIDVQCAVRNRRIWLESNKRIWLVSAKQVDQIYIYISQCALKTFQLRRGHRFSSFFAITYKYCLFFFIHVIKAHSGVGIKTAARYAL